MAFCRGRHRWRGILESAFFTQGSPFFAEGGKVDLDMAFGAEEVDVDGGRGQTQSPGDFGAGFTGQAQADDGLLARREGGEGGAEACAESGAGSVVLGRSGRGLVFKALLLARLCAAFRRASTDAFWTLRRI